MIQPQCITFFFSKAKVFQSSCDSVAFKIDCFYSMEMISGMERSIKWLIVCGAAIHFSGRLLSHLLRSINVHLNKSNTGCAILTVSLFWHICFVLGLTPSEIINQSRAVTNISVWLSHTDKINVLIFGAAKLLCNLQKICPSPLPCPC